MHRLDRSLATSKEMIDMKFQKLFRVVVLGTLILLASVVPSFTAEPQGILKSAEVKALINNSKTPADHQKLARHFTAMAEKHEAEAKEHEALAIEYTKRPTGHEQKHPMSGQTAEHCKYYAEHCRKAAKEMRSLAAAHESMAKASK
ncbi:MAG: hypothetical protein ACKV2U_04705 [Bryobacteraceae bacterium]